MVIDSSALLAILLGEPESRALTTAITRDPSRLVGAPTFVETSIVMAARLGDSGLIALDALLRQLQITVVEMDVAAAMSSRQAYQRFGRGIGSPAVLNFGDCLSYGVAASRGEQLLFVGKDFSQTDIPAAIDV